MTSAPRFFWCWRQHHLRGSERGEDDVLDFERQFFDATNRVLNPRPHAVDDVEIRFESFARACRSGLSTPSCPST